MQAHLVDDIKKPDVKSGFSCWNFLDHADLTTGGFRFALAVGITKPAAVLAALLLAALSALLLAGVGLLAALSRVRLAALTRAGLTLPSLTLRGASHVTARLSLSLLAWLIVLLS